MNYEENLLFVLAILLGGVLLMTYPAKYPPAVNDLNWNAMVDRVDGFTPEGTFRSPYSFLIDFDGTDYYASNAFQVIYGGPDDAGGVDGADKAAVQQAACDALGSGGLIVLNGCTLDGGVTYGDKVLIIEHYQGETTLYGTQAKAHTMPYSYLILTDGTYYYATNGLNIVYGGPNDAGGVAGTDAATVIQAALDGLTSGRTWQEKVIIKGDFVFNSRVNVPSYSIILIDGKVTLGNNINDHIFYSEFNSHLEFHGGILEGNSANNPTNGGGVVLANCSDVIVKGMDIRDTRSAPIYLVVVSDFLVEGNRVADSKTAAGIYLNYNTKRGRVFGNRVENTFDIGIELSRGVEYVDVIGNIIYNQPTASSGINIISAAATPYYSGYINIINNIIINPTAPTVGGNGVGISITAGGHYWINVTGNIVKNWEYDCIHLLGAPGELINNLVVTQNLLQGGYNDLIRLQYLQDSRIEGNILKDPVVAGNYLINLGDNVNLKIKGNIGFVTENSGTATITNSTTVTFTHGLAGTPTHVNASFKTAGYGTWIWSADATNITITVANSGTYNLTWDAEYKP